MPRTAKVTTTPEDTPTPEPLTDEQLRQLYADPNDIIPAHTLDDLVQGMARELGIRTEPMGSDSVSGYAHQSVSEELIQPRGNH